MLEFLQKKGMVSGMKTESRGPGSFRPDYPLAPGRFALGRFAPILNFGWIRLQIWVDVGRFAPIFTLR